MTMEVSAFATCDIDCDMSSERRISPPKKTPPKDTTPCHNTLPVALSIATRSDEVEIHGRQLPISQSRAAGGESQESQQRIGSPACSPSKRLGSTLWDLGLPTELWLQVFLYGARKSQHSVLQAAMACSGLRGPAEEALYRYPRIIDVDTMLRFAAAIDCTPAHRAVVRGIQLVWMRRDNDRFLRAARGLLPKLWRMHTLELLTPMRPFVMERTTYALLNGLTLLYLRRIIGTPIDLTPHLVHILSGFPRLAHLELYEYGRDPEPESHWNAPSLPELLCKLPGLQAVYMPGHRLADMQVAGNLTCLSLRDPSRDDMLHASRLFGRQLVRLRVERYLEEHSCLSYPTDWCDWTGFSSLTYLEVRDAGLQSGLLENTKVDARNLPPSLETLVWHPFLVSNPALINESTRDWKQKTIRAFSETVLRGPTRVKTVVYRWADYRLYHCVLAKAGQYHEVLPVHMGEPLVDEGSWVDIR